MSSKEEEIDMILGMFSDECERYEGTPDSLIIHLPFRFELQVTLPPNGYPDVSYPQLYLLSCPNAQLNALFSQELNKRMKDEIPLGIPMLALLLPLAQTVAEELKESKEKADQAKQAEDEEESLSVPREKELGICIWSGDVIIDRRSRFVAHMARVHSLAEVRQVILHLRSIKHIACAAHPAIYAYRFTDANGVLQQDTDDDGESGASIKMAFLMDQLNVDGYVVVVTRWWGGILLGPDRFKHIMEVTKNMLMTIPEREKEKAAAVKKKSYQ